MSKQPTTDAPASNISEAKLLANIANSLLSTGPRTEAGKARASMNARRHGLTGQFYVMNEDDRRAYEEFEKGILSALQPVGPYETQYAVTISQDHWRLNRSRAIEYNTYGLGHNDHADDYDTDSAETEAAVAQAKTWQDAHRSFTNITLYEARVRRAIAQNEKRLDDLQQVRRSLEAQAREEAELLLRQSVMNGEDLSEDSPIVIETVDHNGLIRADHPLQHEIEVSGFVFSPTELIAAIKRREALESARFYELHNWDSSLRWGGAFHFPPVAPRSLSKAA